MGRLDGRVAFVTGAGRGIGAATALRMAEEGARIALADIDTEGCQQVAAELDRFGSEGFPFTTGTQRTLRETETNTVRAGISYKFGGGF